MLAGEPRILIRPRVVPRPAVESTFRDVRDVVGYQIVAQRVTLVYRDPELPGLGMYRDAGSIANTRRVDSLARSVRIEFEHVGAIGFRLVIGDVGPGAHTGVQLLAIF